MQESVTAPTVSILMLAEAQITIRKVKLQLTRRPESCQANVISRDQRVNIFICSNACFKCFQFHTC